MFQRYDRVSSDRDQTSSAAAAAAATAASAASGNPRHDMTDVEKRRLQSSMTELCNRLRAISSQNLAPPPPDAPSRRSRSRSRAGSTEAAGVVDEAEELERRTGDTFDHNASIKDELKTMASGSPAMHRSSPKASSPNTNKATLNADGKAARPLLKNQGSTSFEDSRTVEGGSVDYSTDNYLSDISCDIP